MIKKMVYQLLNIFLASILLGFSFNMFLLPHSILSGGVTGIAMIFGLLTPINTGTVIFLLNIPILIYGYLKLGKRFITYSLISIAVLSISMQYIPLQPITTDPLLASLFGGVLGGIAIGLIFRHGGSTGGFDILGMILTLRRDLPLGTLIFVMNGAVVFISGFLFNWDLALLTMASIYATGKVIDAIHTRHIKLTLMIITKKGEEIKERLLAHLERGITIMDGTGAYTKESRKILITVVSRYELMELKTIITEADPNAFVNITETLAVWGMFRREIQK